MVRGEAERGKGCVIASDAVGRRVTWAAAGLGQVRDMDREVGDAAAGEGNGLGMVGDLKQVRERQRLELGERRKGL